MDTIVFDEIDKMKDVKSVRYKGKPRRKGVAKVKGMRDYREYFSRRIGLTGTRRNPSICSTCSHSPTLLKVRSRLARVFTPSRKSTSILKTITAIAWKPLPGTKGA